MSKRDGMTLARRRLIAWFLLVGIAAAGVGWLVTIDLRTKISTNVLDLVPGSAKSPELNVVRSLASEAEARTMLFSLHDSTKAVEPAAAALLASELKRDPAFAAAVSLQDLRAKDALGKTIFDRRMTLLFPRWLEEERRAYASSAQPRPEFTAWMADETTRKLNDFVTSPAALAFQDVVPADPLLLMPRVVERLKPALGLFGGATRPGRNALQLTSMPAEAARVAWRNSRRFQPVGFGR